MRDSLDTAFLDDIPHSVVLVPLWWTSLNDHLDVDVEVLDEFLDMLGALVGQGSDSWSDPLDFCIVPKTV